jgi:hypothetical protein
MKVIIRTNRHSRPLMMVCELPPKLQKKARKELDYRKGEDLETCQVFVFKGDVYDVNEFERIGVDADIPKFWNGIKHWSYSNGIVVHWDEKEYDSVVVGTYYVAASGD